MNLVRKPLVSANWSENFGLVLGISTPLLCLDLRMAHRRSHILDVFLEIWLFGLHKFDRGGLIKHTQVGLGQRSGGWTRVLKSCRPHI